MHRTKYPKYLFVWGHPILRWQVYLSIAIVLIFVGGLIGTLTYVMLQNKAMVVPASVISKMPLKEFSELRETPPSRLLSSLQEVIEQHLSATRLNEVTTYVAEGDFGSTVGGEKIVLMARVPNFYKFKTKYSARDMVVDFGYDGKTAWLNHNFNKMSRNAADTFALIGIFESSLAHIAWSCNPELVQGKRPDAVLELLASETWQGRSCYVVRSSGLLPIAIRHYIDAETYREVHRKTKITNKKDAVSEVAIDFDLPDGSSPYGLPMGYKLFIDGSLYDTVKYTKFRINSVIFYTLFDAPVDSSFIDLGTRR